MDSKRVSIYYQFFKQKSASERTYEITKSNIIGYLEGDQIPLSPNFIYLSLCDFTTLIVEYCMNEDESFICLNNFYINPEENKVTFLQNMVIKEKI